MLRMRSGGRSLSYTWTRHTPRMHAHYYTWTATQHSAQVYGKYWSSISNFQIRSRKGLPYPIPFSVGLVRCSSSTHTHAWLLRAYVRRMDGSISMCSATTSFQTEGSAARSIHQNSASPTTKPSQSQTVMIAMVLPSKWFSLPLSLPATALHKCSITTNYFDLAHTGSSIIGGRRCWPLFSYGYTVRMGSFL
jgi:hypothetical protein